MPEGINRSPSPEEQKRQQEKEDAAQLATHFVMHPEQLNPPIDLGEAGPEIAEFKNMITSFESTHSLENLHLIVELSPELNTLFAHDRDMSIVQIESALKNLIPEDAKKYEIRRVARRDITPIATKLNTFKGNKRYEALKVEYLRLSRAVGIIGKDYKIDYNR